VHLDIPWWTFEAIDAIDAFLEDRPNARVFEWGAGASTVWLSRRAAEVVAVEHDAEWANRVKGYTDALGNVRLHMVAPARQGMIGSGKTGFEGQFFDEYVEFIHCIPGEFDLIVIDGRAREACLSEAVSRLAPSGLIVFDDFKRKRYQTALARHRFHIRQLDGLSACLPLPDSTALLSLADT